MRVYVIKGYDPLSDSIRIAKLFLSKDNAQSWIEDNQTYDGQYFISEYKTED